MEDKELISVIVPVYNVEKYLDRCIKSICGQTYDNLEIILVDDGSTDNSSQMCDKWSKKDSRIRVIHKENGGLSSARNAGIDASAGTYIGFIDSDDYILPTMYETLYTGLKANDADVSICDYAYIDETGNSVKELNDLEFIEELLDKKDALNRLNPEFYPVAHYVVAYTKLYKKFIFEDIRFPKGRIHEDEFVIHRIMDKCRKIYVSKQKLYMYVQRKGSIMNTCYSIKHLDAADAFLERRKFFLDKNMQNLANITVRQIYWVLRDILCSEESAANKRKCRNYVKKTESMLVKNGDLRWVKLMILWFVKTLR